MTDNERKAAREAYFTSSEFAAGVRHTVEFQLRRITDEYGLMDDFGRLLAYEEAATVAIDEMSRLIYSPAGQLFPGQRAKVERVRKSLTKLTRQIDELLEDDD